MSSAVEQEEPSILDKLDQAVPTPLARFDAFPKLPSTYKARSESRGFFTIFVGLLALLLVLNDIGEFIWGWPDYEFSVDTEKASFMDINVDMVVNMPCRYLSVDLRDSLGDRLLLSGGLRRDGAFFDVGQATTLQAHSAALSARQAIAQSRSSRGFFATLFRRDSSLFRPTYNHKYDSSACRLAGSLEVKKVTANLHITTLGHGYASHDHVDHSLMNLSHVITEFSFGPYFPDITQPLDYSFEATTEPFIAYQYFIHVVPTTYIAPRTKPLHTHQYSVTHYTRVLQHGSGTPGIFFKFDLEPLSLTIHQRTTTFMQLMIRCVGVIGGVFVCMGYAIRITSRAVEVVTGADQAPGIVAAEASGVKVGLRQKWGGGKLRSRANDGRMVQQGNGWVLEGPSSPYSNYTSTPMTGTFGSPVTASLSVPSPFSASLAPPTPGTPNPGLGFRANSPVLGPPPRSPRSSTSGRPVSPGSSYLPTSPILPMSALPPTSENRALSPTIPALAPPRRVSGPKKDD